MEKLTARSVSAACIGLLFLACVVAAQTTDARTAVRFRLSRDYLIVVSVRVGEAGDFDFLLDTGANSTVVTPELAARLKLRPSDRLEMRTVAGSRITPRAWLPRLTLGSKSAENVEVLIAELGELRRSDSRIDGILGQNFLARFNYTLDYRKRRIEFVEANEPGPRGARLPVEHGEGQLLVTAHAATGDGKALRLVLDSASPCLILFGPHQEFDLEPGAASWVLVSTNAGSGLALTGVLRTLRVGGESFHSLPAAFIRNRAATERPSESGLLPTRLFRAVYFDNRAGYVILNPRPPEKAKLPR